MNNYKRIKLVVLGFRAFQFNRIVCGRGRKNNKRIQLGVLGFRAFQFKRIVCGRGRNNNNNNN